MTRLTAFDMEVQSAYAKLIDLPEGRRRVVVYSPGSGLLFVKRPSRRPRPNTVGTYDWQLDRDQFTEDCRFVAGAGR
jgi:hypothetical protein